MMPEGIKPRFVMERASVQALLNFGAGFDWDHPHVSRQPVGPPDSAQIDQPRSAGRFMGSRSRFPTCAADYSDVFVEGGFSFHRQVCSPSASGVPQGAGEVSHDGTCGCAVLLTGTICVGDVFILHVYRKPYHDAAWMIAIFGLGLWHTLLYNTITPAIFSLQKAHYNAFGYLLYCIIAVRAAAGGILQFGWQARWLQWLSAICRCTLYVYASQRQGTWDAAPGRLHDAVFCSNAGGGICLRHAFGLGLPFPGCRRFTQCG